MNYELAKKLKDAGFFQPIEGSGERGQWWNDKGQEVTVNGELGWGVSFRTYEPPLSELIEACGNRFFKLEGGGGQKFFAGFGVEPKYWNAISQEIYVCEHCKQNRKKQETIGQGNTPEEAVANLWLKLNEAETHG